MCLCLIDTILINGIATNYPFETHCYCCHLCPELHYCYPGCCHYSQVLQDQACYYGADDPHEATQTQEEHLAVLQNI